MPPVRTGGRALASALACSLLPALHGATPGTAAAEPREWVSALSVFGEARSTDEAQDDERAIFQIVADEDLRLEDDEGEEWVPAIAMIGEVAVERGNGTGTDGDGSVPAVAVLSVPSGASDAATESVILAASGAQVYAEREKSELERWVPGFSFESGVTVQKVEAAVRSSPVLGPSVPGVLRPQNELRPSTNDDADMITPWVGADFEIMTPGLLDVPGSPRLFAHAGGAGSLSNDRDVAKEGNPGQLGFAEGINFGDENNIAGQGSKTRATVQPLTVTAGAGVAFTLDAWGRTVRIKPSVEYLRQVIEVTGQLKRAIALFPDNQTGSSLDDFRLISLRATDEKTFHGLGPGLTIEADTGRVGPMLLTVYFSGSGYKILNDRMIKLTASNEFDETARFLFETNDWTYKGGVGVRFRWVPD